jgi:hypothetical protein
LVLPAESLTEVILEVALFQPMARMLVSPATCARVYPTATDDRPVCGVTASTCTNAGGCNDGSSGDRRLIGLQCHRIHLTNAAVCNDGSGDRRLIGLQCHRIHLHQRASATTAAVATAD